jgi:hypothetical protein
LTNFGDAVLPQADRRRRGGQHQLLAK